MGLADKLIVGAGFRTLTTVVGGAAAAAYGTLSGIGKAVGSLADATRGAADAAKQKGGESPSNIIYVNFGMAGSAGKQKVSGRGTLPSKPVVAKPQVSEKMPTEALLDTAVKYLTSIDKSLKAQLEFEKRAYEQQVRDDREAIVENKSTFNFSDIKDRLSGLKSNVKENSGLAVTLGKYALGLGAAAALIASTLDQKELDALKENVNEFKKSFGWLAELGAVVGAGGLFGFLFGGKGFVGRIKGGLVGMVASHVLDRLYSSFAGGYKKDENGNVLIDPQTGEPIKESRSMSVLGTGLSVAAGVYAGRSIVKALPGVRQAGATAAGLARATTAGSISQVQTATRKGTSWLASRRGRKFLIFLGRRLGKGLMAKLGKYLARIVASLLLAATGVGAIPGIISILFNVAFIAWDLYDIATAIWDAWNDSKEEDTAAAAVPAGTPEADATRVIGTDANGQPITAAPVTNDVILKTIRMKESTNDYGAQNPNSTASGAYQFIDGTWQALTRKYGIGTEYSKAKYAPPAIQDAVADKYVSEILQQANGDVSKVPVAWYTGNVQGVSNHATPAQVAAYQADWLRIYNGGNPQMSAATNSSFNDSASLGSAIGSAVGAAANASAETLGKLFGTIGGAVVKPGVERTFTPSTPDVSSRINNDSMKIQNDITFGVKALQKKDIITAPTGQSTPDTSGQPIKTISSMDPNYQNIDIIKHYVAHFRMAA